MRDKLNFVATILEDFAVCGDENSPLVFEVKSKSLTNRGGKNTVELVYPSQNAGVCSAIGIEERCKDIHVEDRRACVRDLEEALETLGCD